MIRINSLVIERAVDFITILEEDFPRHCNTVFTISFPRFSMTSSIPELLFCVHVTYTLFLSMLNF